MAWAVLFVAGLLEVVWAMGLKASEGFSKLWPSVVTIITMVTSFGLLSHALKTIPVGTGYAVWTGIGAVGSVIAGIMFMGEPNSASRSVFLALIVLGILGLKFTSGH